MTRVARITILARFTRGGGEARSGFARVRGFGTSRRESAECSVERKVPPLMMDRT